MKDIMQIAKEFGIDAVCYGNNVAKVKGFVSQNNVSLQKTQAQEKISSQKVQQEKNYSLQNSQAQGNVSSQEMEPQKISLQKVQPEGKIVLVTAMTSNASGIGKTTTSIGLADALSKMGRRVALALREPSMGPVFGIKGGACGGGKSQIVPSDQINLHFTGDFAAIEAANNLLSAIVDNHIFQGNALGINPKQIFHRRCLDINDRSLRKISYEINGEAVETGFVITAASEVMAIVALSENFAELKENLGNILLGLNFEGKPIFARDLHAQDAMAILLKDAFLPNLVQTLCGTPAFVHMGPFANVAHGCNSIVATRAALKCADVCVTEAGFGSDLGAEKFLDIKCRKMGGVQPSAVVLVATLQVVKQHGQGDVLRGFLNVAKHIESVTKAFDLPCVVAINRHCDDDENELLTLKNLCEKEGVKAVLCNPFDEGASGCMELAKQVEQMLELPQEVKKAQEFQKLQESQEAQKLHIRQKSEKLQETQKLQEPQKPMRFCYECDDSVEKKIEKIATKIYGAKEVEYSDIAKQKLALVHSLGLDKCFVNIAKTQFSFSDNPKLLGAPKDFVFHISDLELRTGAGVIVAVAGGQVLLPGLGKNSNYLNMKILDDGTIEGIF